jgi:hypothetical protein
MPKFVTSAKNYIKVKKEGKNLILISKEKFESFNEDVLGLGKIGAQSEQINAISVLFDLEGFTNFCKQIDPHLAIPEYLSEFLKWLFDQVRKELIQQTHTEGYLTYSELPFLAKFMGDGILFLWNIDGLSDVRIRNIVVSMYEICEAYQKEFYKKITKKIVNPPSKLRCGIARGTIYSVGNGNDFVGPCINMSARLQKLNSLTFCFSRRGLNPEGNDYLNKLVVTKKVDIRGIGSDELVCVVKTEYDKLEQVDKDKFIEP